MGARKTRFVTAVLLKVMLVLLGGVEHRVTQYFKAKETPWATANRDGEGLDDDAFDVLIEQIQYDRVDEEIDRPGEIPLLGVSHHDSELCWSSGYYSVASC